MNKLTLHWRAFAIALLLLPGLVMAQHYNNLHRFSSEYTRSANTCAIHLNNSKIVEGGTVRPANSLVSSVELGFVDISSGTLIPHPLTYSVPFQSHAAADLIESLGDPGHVVCAANLNSVLSISTTVSVFKTDPSTGVVDWSLVYKSPNGAQVANAITRDNQKNYYVLGNARLGNREAMYLIKVDDSGTPIWERYYFRSNTLGEVVRGVDLIFDGTNIVIVGNLKSNLVRPSGRGLVITQIDPATGLVLNTHNLQHLDGSREINARDITQVNGNYVIVGELNPSIISPVLTPRRGFMVVYTPALAVAANRVYADPQNRALRVSGVRNNLLGNLLMSYDLGTNTRTNWIPGLMDTDNAGKVNAALLYKVKGYLGTNGLIKVNSFFVPTVMIKGSVNNPSFFNGRALSLIGDGPIISSNPNLCSDKYEIKNERVKYEDVAIKLGVERVETVDKIKLNVSRVDGRSIDCNGNSIGSFRLAASTETIEEAEKSNFAIFPNPSNGKFTIQLDENQVDSFQTGEITDVMGKTVAIFNINSSNLSIDLTDQTPGLYLLRMKSSNGQVSKTERIMVR